MEKDFESWHELKKLLERESSNKALYFKPKEIWMCLLGLNIGSEQDGRGTSFSRPVLVFKVFNQDTFLGICVTSQKHYGSHCFKFNIGGVDQFVNLSQIRTLSTKRFERKMATLPHEIFSNLKERFYIFMKNEIPLAGEISEAEAKS